MTMTMDTQQRHHLGSLGFDHMPYSATSPAFTNPWAGTTAAHSSSQYFPTAAGASGLNYDSLSKSHLARSTMSMPYSSLPASAPPIGSGNFPNLPFSQSELLTSSQDLLNSTRSTYDQSYTSAPSQSTATYATHPGTYAPLSSYGQSLGQQQQQQEGVRRLSQSAIAASHPQSTFGDALDGARGMVAMSQDMTPRNIYGPRGDQGSDSYGFPTTHSAHSSISSGPTYSQYYDTPSVNSSVTDYSSASESIDSLSSRTLPRPTGLTGTTLPPAPQSMMGSFNSKVSSNTQKKHKCKVCDKRFTRPSSLQTHMYSHTGEKPFACEVHGCGRNFSVVSNLRRHRKVHKGERLSDHGSPEGSWQSEKSVC